MYESELHTPHHQVFTPPTTVSGNTKQTRCGARKTHTPQHPQLKTGKKAKIRKIYCHVVVNTKETHAPVNLGNPTQGEDTHRVFSRKRGVLLVAYLSCGEFCWERPKGGRRDAPHYEGEMTEIGRKQNTPPRNGAKRYTASLATCPQSRHKPI